MPLSRSMKASLDDGRRASDTAIVPNLHADGTIEAAQPNEATPLTKSTGSSRIEAFYAVFGRSWGFWGFCAAFAVWTFAISLSSDTTYVCESEARRSRGAAERRRLAVRDVGILPADLDWYYLHRHVYHLRCHDPFLVRRGIDTFYSRLMGRAELANFTTRPTTLLASIILYTLGYLITAVSSTVSAVCAGQIVYTLGNSGLEYLETLLVADLTTLQWRGFMIGFIDLSYIPFAFVAGNITDGVGLQNWRWGVSQPCRGVTFAHR